MVSDPVHLFQRGRLSDSPSREDAITPVAGHQEATTQIVVVTSSGLVIGLLSVLFTVDDWEGAVFGRIWLYTCFCFLMKHSDFVGDQLCPGHWSLVGALYCGGWLLVCCRLPFPWRASKSLSLEMFVCYLEFSELLVVSWSRDIYQYCPYCSPTPHPSQANLLSSSLLLVHLFWVKVSILY